MMVTCAISGQRFNVAGFDRTAVPASVGDYHPVFTLPYKELYKLYYQHTRNKLNPTESYLLFCAFLNNTEQVEWRAPATCQPNDAATIKLVQNNLSQLIAVTEKTVVIRHPSFKQPSFVVTYENGSLAQVHNWIEAWQENLARFNLGEATKIQQRDLARIERDLDAKLVAGTPLEELPGIVANWASQAAGFPHLKDEQYQRVIRSCFNASKMFNTPLALIREVQEYCYANIEVDSVHFHTLSTMLKEGASRHLDYLGGSSLALGYTLLDTTARTIAVKEGDLKTQAELTTIAETAPAEPPKQEDYPNKVTYLRARLAYMVATGLKTIETKQTKELNL